MNPDFAIIEEKQVDGREVLIIDTKKAKYQGKAWLSLGDFGKRKFENMLILTKQKPLAKVMYV